VTDEVPEWVVERTRTFVEHSGTGDEPAMYHSPADDDGATHHVVVVTGDFTLPAARLPIGASPPRGSIAILDWSSRGSGVSLPRVQGDNEAFLGKGTPFFYKRGAIEHSETGDEET
jgi:hypothetical protein